MDTIHQFFSHLYHFQDLIRWGGYTALTIIVFCETGILAGFFFPGDSLLVTAGLIAALDGTLTLHILIPLLCAAAIVGDSVGYAIGRYFGGKLENKPDSFFFRREHLERTKAFYGKYGAKTIVLARFVPIVRTFAPTVAGMAAMNYRTFIVYNVVGGIGWVVSMLLTGYFLARSIPDVEKKIHWILLAVIAISFLPIVKEFWEHRRQKAGQ
jgi:membrane-associated protein